MSSSTSATIYKFAFYLDKNDNVETAFFEFSDACGMNDASALALAAAMRDVGWPAGTTAVVTVERAATTADHSTGDLNADPPAFT